MDRIGLTEGYKDYVSTVENPVDRAVYVDITSLFLKHFMTKVFEGYATKMGAGLGTITIKGKKIKPYIDQDGNIKGAAIDWGETNKLAKREAEEQGIPYEQYLTENKGKRKLVYCFNEHSNGVKYNILWQKDEIAVKHHQFYELRFSFHNRRANAKNIKSGAEYETIPERQVVNNIYRRKSKRKLL